MAAVGTRRRIGQRDDTLGGGTAPATSEQRLYPDCRRGERGNRCHARALHYDRSSRSPTRASAGRSSGREDARAGRWMCVLLDESRTRGTSVSTARSHRWSCCPNDTSGNVRVYPRPLGDVDDDVSALGLSWPPTCRFIRWYGLGWRTCSGCVATSRLAAGSRPRWRRTCS